MTYEQALDEFKVLENGSAFISKNFKSLQKEYPDMFIAVEDSGILAISSSFVVVVVKLNEKGKEPSKVIIEYIPQKGEIILY